MHHTLNGSAERAGRHNSRDLPTTPNVGSLDRTLRIVAGVAIVGWGVYAQNWLGAIGLVPLATGLLRWCPVYLPIKRNTDK